MAVAVIVGGTASVISGGKFANGAVTGAFSRAFNDELHKRELENAAVREHFMKYGVYPRINGERQQPSYWDKLSYSLNKLWSVDHSGGLVNVAVDAYDHNSFQRNGQIVSLALAGGSLTPCSGICATAGLIVDGTLTADEWLFGAGTDAAILTETPAASGIMYQKAMGYSGISVPGAGKVGAAASIITTLFMSEEYLPNADAHD